MTNTTTMNTNEHRLITRRLDYFGGSAHGYQLDGEKVEGVTTIIRNGLPHPEFQAADRKKVAQYAIDNLDLLTRLQPDEAIDLCKNAPVRQLQSAGQRGKNIHQLAEDLANGEKVEPPDELIGPIEQLLRFYEEWNVEPVAAEFSVINRQWRFMGSPDLLCRLGRRRKLALLDYKTGSGVFPDAAYQLTAYAWCDSYITKASAPGWHDERRMPLAPEQPPPDHVVLDPETGETVRVAADDSEFERLDLVAVLHLQDDGYELLPVDAGRRTFREFLYIAQVAQIDDARKSQLISAAIAPALDERGTE